MNGAQTHSQNNGKFDPVQEYSILFIISNGEKWSLKMHPLLLTGIILKAVPDECVDFGDIDVVHLLDGMFDLVLVGLDVNDEHQCVVVLDLLHGRLRRQGELDDGIVVQPEGRAKHASDQGPNAVPCLQHLTCHSIGCISDI